MTPDAKQWQTFLDAARAQCASVTEAFVHLKLETTTEHAAAFFTALKSLKKSADEIGYERVSLLCVPVEAVFKSFLEKDEAIPENALGSAEAALDNIRAALAEDADPPEGRDHRLSDGVAGVL